MPCCQPTALPLRPHCSRKAAELRPTLKCLLSLSLCQNSTVAKGVHFKQTGLACRGLRVPAACAVEGPLRPSAPTAPSRPRAATATPESRHLDSPPSPCPPEQISRPNFDDSVPQQTTGRDSDEVLQRRLTPAPAAAGAPTAAQATRPAGQARPWVPAKAAGGNLQSTMQLLLQGLVALALLLSMLQERSAIQAVLCLILVRLAASWSSVCRCRLPCFSVLQPGGPVLQCVAVGCHMLQCVELQCAARGVRCQAVPPCAEPRGSAQAGALDIPLAHLYRHPGSWLPLCSPYMSD